MGRNERYYSTKTLDIFLLSVIEGEGSTPDEPQITNTDIAKIVQDLDHW